MIHDLKAAEEKRKGKIPYDYYKSILKDHDPMKMQFTTGCIYNEEKNELKVKVMDSRYIVRYPSGEVYKEDYSELEDYSVKTLLLRYLMKANGALPLNKNITYRDIPGGNVYFGNFYGRCIERLAKTFDKNLEGFEKACKSIGGEKVSIGDAAYRFEFVNNVYITFVLWRGDEEFSASAQILFDGNISCYFDAEDMAFIGDISISRLKQIAAMT